MYLPRSTIDGGEGDESLDSNEARPSTWMCRLNTKVARGTPGPLYMLEPRVANQGSEFKSRSRN